jgi:glycosyltransferase involved in cell wall biosynthesis
MTQAIWSDHAFVVLAYGNSPFLSGCLTSLAEQTVASRIVVATSTPSDEIAEAARSAGAVLHVNPQRQGIGADWNFGLDRAGARYVTLVHQDDVYYPRFLERTRRLFADHPDGALAFTGFRQIGDYGEPVRSKISLVKYLLSAAILGGSERVTGWRRRLFLSFGNPLPCSSVTFDLQRLNGFRFSTDLASNLDWDGWWRLHEQDRLFLHESERLIGRRHNDLTETSRLIRDGRRKNEDEAMFERIWPRPVARLIARLYAAGYR